MHRAAHQLFEQDRLYDDPLTIALIGSEAEAELRNGLARQAQPSAKPMRAFIVVRSRFAEDRVRAAFARGTRQCVLLGAGLDTLAYRLGPDLLEMTFFEVDRPETQAWKRQRMSDAASPVPPNVRYAPVNFESGELSVGLERTGFRRAEPAVFVWLGVVPYLTRDASTRTLSFVARTQANEIVFDYAEPFAKTDSYLNELARRVAEIGEPLLTFFRPDALVAELRTVGFSNCEDWDAAKLNSRYFDGRSDGLRLGTRGHIMHARV